MTKERQVALIAAMKANLEEIEREVKQGRLLPPVKACWLAEANDKLLEILGQRR